MNHKAAEILATVLLGGEWSRIGCQNSLVKFIGRSSRPPKWNSEIVECIFAKGEFLQLPSETTLRRFLQQTATSNILSARTRNSISKWASTVDYLSLPARRMTPQTEAARNWQFPEITTTGALADRLDVCPKRLDWLADHRGLERIQQKEKLRNYRYAWVKKTSGGRRLVECPKANLKSIQRWILNNVLNRIPPHAAAHGFVAERSPVTAAKIHVNQNIVLRIDLRDFFTAITARRVAGIFHSVGYPSRVATLLTGLCTNTTWEGVLDELGSNSMETDIWKVRHKQLFTAHLPQGAPSSPALANLIAYSLDCRLAGLAQKFESNYSRYADDLIFSGDRNFAASISDFRIRCLAIAHNEGFDIQRRKTRVMRSHEQQKVTGIVVNQQTNISRREFDTLKAILHNCIIHGPQAQNRFHIADFEAHLRGRIAWVGSLNEQRGEKLLHMFQQIRWPQKADLNGV